MPSAFQIKSFLTYWLDAVDDHSLHSPFFFDLYNKVISSKSPREEFSSIETLRKKLLTSDATINVTDLGAGSQTLSGTSRKISEIASTSLTTPKYAALYARLAKHFFCSNIVELGTSLGVNSLYLASSGAKVTTFEGAPEIVNYARSTFEFAGAKNISIQEGNIDKTLPAFLQLSGKIDLAFIDANHRYEPTLRYANLLMSKTHIRSVVILDDIHYSPEMEDAWHLLQKHSLVYGSADLYRCGILFFDPSLNKQHVVLQF
jgi:predicted O-methyltransferase YrrM